MRLRQSQSTGRWADVLMASIWTSIAWKAITTKFISRQSFVNLPWHSRIMSASVGAAVPSRHQKESTFYGVTHEELIEHWSFGEVAFLSLVGRRPNQQELSEYQLLLGLLLTNGPGTISAQGCKGGVSSDGPEQPGRVQVNKAYLGFLSHTGYAHGGNGFEAIDFLLDLFWDDPLTDPCNPEHGLDLAHKANKCVQIEHRAQEYTAPQTDTDPERAGFPAPQRYRKKHQEGDGCG